MALRTNGKILLTTAAVAALVAACGSGGTPGGSSGQIQTMTPGKLTCAMSGEYRPFNYYGSDTKLQGFDVDMCTEIAKHLKLDPNPLTGQFDSLIAGLQAGRYDAIIGSMANTPKRAQQVDFSKPYYTSGTQLFVAPASSVQDISGLKDATIGVALGTTFEEFARKQSNVKNVKTYKSDIEALKDLETGRLDGVITQGLMGRFLIKNADLKVKPVGGVLEPDVASIPVKKGNTALLGAIDKALVDIKKDGTYAKLSNKWFGEDISAGAVDSSTATASSS